MFADVEEDTGNLDPQAAEAVTDGTDPGRRGGRLRRPPGRDATRCMPWPTASGALLLEDAAHSIGSRYRGRPVGTLADLTTFSFFPTKNMTTAEGGAVAALGPGLADAGRTVPQHRPGPRPRTSCATPTRARGTRRCHELRPELPAARRAVRARAAASSPGWRRSRPAGPRSSARYDEGLAERAPASGCRPSATTSTRPGTCTRSGCSTAAAARCSSGCARPGIGVQVNYIPVYWHPVFEDLGYRRGMCPNAETYYAEEISLPLFADLTDAEQDRVIDAVRRRRGG